MQIQCKGVLKLISFIKTKKCTMPLRLFCNLEQEINNSAITAPVCQFGKKRPGKPLFIPGMGAGEWRRLGNAAGIFSPLDMGVSPRIWGNKRIKGGKHMKKKLLALLLALCMVFALAACGSGGDDAADDTGGNSSGDTITIGMIAPMTGTNAAYGNSMLEGVQMTIDEINEAGGILGMQVELDYRDDQGDATQAQNAFNALIAEGVTLIIGSATSGATSALTSLANEEGVVLITPSATADDITTEDDYVFRACFKDTLQGGIAAAYVDQQGITRVGTIACSADTYSQGLVDAFAQACEERGIEVVEQQNTATMNAQDFTNQFTAMVNADVELVYAVYYYDAVGPFLVTQARSAGYDGIIMGADGYDGALDYVSEGVDYSAFNNVVYTNHYDATDSSEVVQNYVTSYGERYGTTPLCFAALASDCMMMLQTAMETAGTAEASAVRDALADTSVTYEGVTGTFTLDETGTPVKGAAVISFVYDESVGGLEGLGTELVTTISADEIA